MTPFFLAYVYTTITSFMGFAIAVSGISGGLTVAWLVISLIIYYDSYGQEKEKAQIDLISAKLWAKRVALSVLIVGSLSSFVPSKEDLTFIVGAGTLTTLAQNPEAQKLPNNILSTVNSFLESVKKK